MKAIRRAALAVIPILVLVSGLQAAVLKEAVLSVKGMVCSA